MRRATGIYSRALQDLASLCDCEHTSLLMTLAQTCLPPNKRVGTNPMEEFSLFSYWNESSTYLVLVELDLDTDGLTEAALLVLPFIDDVIDVVMDAAAVRSDSGLSSTGGMTDGPAPGSPALPPSPNKRSIGVAVFLRAYNI